MYTRIFVTDEVFCYVFCSPSQRPLAGRVWKWRATGCPRGRWSWLQTPATFLPPQSNSTFATSPEWCLQGRKTVAKPDHQVRFIYVCWLALVFIYQSLSLLMIWPHRTHPVLIQGETSVGKTSLIRWLAAATGNQCVRINNHEHTDIQEYIGCYSSDDRGKLMFKEGMSTHANLF